MGGQDYITKPFQELEVLARVQNQLLIQQQKQQLQQEIQIRKQAESEVRQLNTGFRTPQCGSGATGATADTRASTSSKF